MALPEYIRIAGYKYGTILGSLSMQYGGGVSSISRTDTMLGVAQASSIRPTGFSVSLFPVSESEEQILPVILSLGGLIPVILPNGTRYAVSPAGPHSIGGFVDNKTNTYETTWKIEPTALIADVFMNETLLSEYGYSLSSPSFYQGAGSSRQVLLPSSGVRFTGDGVYIHTFIEEREVLGNRHNVYFESEIYLSGVGQGAFGVNTSASSAQMPFGNTGIGIEWNGSSLRILDINGNIINSVVAGNGLYRTRIVISTNNARIEVFNGRQRIMYVHSIPWPYNIEPRMIFNVKSGSATLRRWYGREI